MDHTKLGSKDTVQNNRRNTLNCDMIVRVEDTLALISTEKTTVKIFHHEIVSPSLVERYAATK